MTRHIVFLNPVGMVGGAERILLTMVQQTRTLHPDWTITAVLLGDGPLVAILESLGVRVVVLPLPSKAAKLGDTQLRSGSSRVSKVLSLLKTALTTGPAGIGFVRRLKKTLRELKPDLIHSNGLKSHLLTSLARPRGTPIVWHLHDFYSHRPLICKHIRRFTGGVAGAIAISHAVEVDAAPLLGTVPITTILNAIDTDHFTPGPPANVLPAVPGEVCVGLVATYANWKGQDVFLQAEAKVTAAARFFIIGGPIYATAGSQFSLAELEAMAKSLGIVDRVTFLPFTPDTREVYRGLDVVVHASTRAEPFGLTIVEAMACGRAVIVANAGGASELFTEGVDALGHVPGDADSLARAMTRLITDAALRQSLGDNARRHAVECFDQSRFGRELMALYEHVLDAPL
ncbi:N/A [soil metagenome]